MIEGLNSDMLSEVFKHLNTEGMKQLRLTNKKLKDAVDNSIEIKKRKAVLENLHAIGPKLAFVTASVRDLIAIADKFDSKVGPYINKLRSKPKVDKDLANNAKIMKAYLAQCRKEFATVVQQLIILKANYVESADQTMKLIKEYEDKDPEIFERKVGLQMKDMVEYRKQYAPLKGRIDEVTALVLGCGNSLASLHDMMGKVEKSAS